MREELAKISSPDVVEFVDIASKTLDREEFNAFVNQLFTQKGIIKKFENILLNKNINMFLLHQ